MKRLWAMAITLVMVFGSVTVQAVPYTEAELEEYMEAIYCEPVWATAFDEYRVQFVDVDLDGRMELITMEAGEEYAPKKAEIYAFMDAEFSGRGCLTVGKLEVCRDPETDESFVINRLEQDGQMSCQRLVYDHENELISAVDLSEDCAARLEDYGYSPVTVTNADYQGVRVYEDCRAIFLPAYRNTVYTNGAPPVTEYDETDESWWDTVCDRWLLWAVLLAVAAVLITVTAVMLRYRGGKKTVPFERKR